MRKAYAADFGAGNTCLYCAKPNAKIREATPLNTPGGEPSGYALDNRSSVLLGMGLYGLQYHNLEQIDSFHINLKAQPTEANRKELIFYFHSWLEKMKKDHPEEFQDVDKMYWFIGCPTGEEWKQEEAQEQYKSIFEQAGFENVYIVPESNAALAFYQQKDRLLEEYGEETRLLLIDQGAYSLDVTNYSNGKVTSYGGYLGASLIERMMIHVILYMDEEKIRLKKRMINWPQTVEAARAKYEQEGVTSKFYTYLLLQARRLKEDYFTALNNKTLIDTADIMRTLDFEVEGEQLILFTNPSIMELILEKMPVRQALGAEFDTLAPEVRNEVGNQTWMQVFRAFLDRVDQEYPDLGKGSNTIIMVTGGGSLMSCVPQNIKSHYPLASFHYDMEAIAAIGKGMAYWAPDKIQALDFQEAFEAFTDKEVIDEDGDSVNSINQKLAAGLSDCLMQLLKDVTDEEAKAVVYGVVEWREYRCGRGDIPQKIEQHLNNWCKNTGMPSFMSNIDNHITSLKEELNADFHKTTAAFGIEQIELLKKEDAVFLSDCKKMLPLCFDGIVECIVSHYKKIELWSQFPDSRKRLFSDPRADFCNAAAEMMNDWIGKEVEGTVDLCKQVFFDMEFNITDEMKYTFYQLFLIEGRFDLLNLMKAHVKEILGRLVLEEYI